MRFEDVLEIKNGRNQKAVENPQGKYPIYGSGGIMGYADDYICAADTVVIGRKGSINNPLFVDEPFWNVDTAFGLQSNRDLLFPRYLYYFCKHFDFERLNKTVTIPSLTKSDLLKIEIDLPDLGVQQRIVAKLASVERVMQLRKQQLVELDTLVKARFVEMIRENKPSYVKLKDVVEEDRIITYGIVKPGEYTEGGIPIIKVKDFPNGVILMHDMLLASPEIESKYERSRVREGDLLFSIRGSVGRTAFVPKELTDANITQDTARLSISDNFSPKYVRAALEYDPVQYDISQYVRGVAVRGINLADLREIEIPVVDLALQEQFAAFVEQTDKSKVIDFPA